MLIPLSPLTYPVQNIVRMWRVIQQEKRRISQSSIILKLINSIISFNLSCSLKALRMV